MVIVITSASTPSQKMVQLFPFTVSPGQVCGFSTVGRIIPPPPNDQLPRLWGCYPLKHRIIRIQFTDWWLPASVDGPWPAKKSEVRGQKEFGEKNLERNEFFSTLRQWHGCWWLNREIFGALPPVRSLKDGRNSFSFTHIGIASSRRDQTPKTNILLKSGSAWTIGKNRREHNILVLINMTERTGR